MLSRKKNQLKKEHKKGQALSPSLSNAENFKYNVRTFGRAKAPGHLVPSSFENAIVRRQWRKAAFPRKHEKSINNLIPQASARAEL